MALLQIYTKDVLHEVSVDTNSDERPEADSSILISETTDHQAETKTQSTSRHGNIWVCTPL
jgi:hypothetical protein